MSNKKMLEDAAKKFIKKVETGKARSKETYRELKEAMGLESKKIMQCNKCGYTCFEEDCEDLACPRCGKPIR